MSVAVILFLIITRSQREGGTDPFNFQSLGAFCPIPVISLCVCLNTSRNRELTPRALSLQTHLTAGTRMHHFPSHPCPLPWGFTEQAQLTFPSSVPQTAGFRVPLPALSV